MQRKISGITKFPEIKYNLERLTEIFEVSFRKFSLPFDFGRMERAQEPPENPRPEYEVQPVSEDCLVLKDQSRQL